MRKHIQKLTTELIFETLSEYYQDVFFDLNNRDHSFHIAKELLEENGLGEELNKRLTKANLITSEDS